MKACVSSVGSGAPRGRAAIQRSACSSTGERSNSPLGPFAQPPIPAPSRDVAILLTPRDVGVDLPPEPIGIGLEPSLVIEEDEIELGERGRHRIVAHGTQDDGGEALVEPGGEGNLL